MASIGLLSDTHGHLDDAILELLDPMDEIWHAGDFGTVDVLDRLKVLDKPVRAVYGNVDGAKIRAELVEDLRFEIEGVSVFMTHIGGYPPRYNRRTRPMIHSDPPDLMIAGHSHILKVMRDQDIGTLHMNPGAAGHHGFHPIRTMLTFHISSGKIHDVQAVELGRRGHIT